MTGEVDDRLVAGFRHVPQPADGIEDRNAGGRRVEQEPDVARRDGTAGRRLEELRERRRIRRRVSQAGDVLVVGDADDDGAARSVGRRGGGLDLAKAAIHRTLPGKRSEEYT